MKKKDQESLRKIVIIGLVLVVGYLGYQSMTSGSSPFSHGQDQPPLKPRITLVGPQPRSIDQLIQQAKEAEAAVFQYVHGTCPGGLKELKVSEPYFKLDTAAENYLFNCSSAVSKSHAKMIAAKEEKKEKCEGLEGELFWSPIIHFPDGDENGCFTAFTGWRLHSDSTSGTCCVSKDDPRVQ